MAENEPQKSKRELLMERLNARYPDRQYADDEELFGQIDEDYAASDEELGRYREREQVLSDGLAKNPEAAQFFVQIMRGENPWTSLVNMVGIDGVADLMNDPTKQEELAEANKAYLERLAKEKSLEEEYQANFAESLRTLERVQAERGLSDEEIDAAMDWVMGVVNDAVVGKFDGETIDMALKALNHDDAVAEARSEGEVAGRNAKITETLRKSKAGDGLPAMEGANNGPTHKRSKGSLVDYAESIGIKV